MSLWTNSLLSLLLLPALPLQLQAQELANDTKPAVIEEAPSAAEELPHRLDFTRRDFELTQAYSDLFKILSTPNTCSNFYGGPRNATTVLNELVPLVKSHRLLKELSFQMKGRPRIMHNPVTNFSYRLFDNAIVNSDGSFYQRRLDSLRRFPADVGSFQPGTRPARALILLHELGHLIQGDTGTWLIPDDGHDGALSNRNTLLVQRACRRQLDALK
jgi:hypothetical protein